MAILRDSKPSRMCRIASPALNVATVGPGAEHNMLHHHSIFSLGQLDHCAFLSSCHARRASSSSSLCALRLSGPPSLELNALSVQSRLLLALGRPALVALHPVELLLAHLAGS